MKKACFLLFTPFFFIALTGCGSGRARQVQSYKANLNAYIQKGEAYVRQGNHRHAYTHYTTYVRYYSRYPQLKYETARLYLERGKVALAMRYPKKAEEDFALARRLYPGIKINVNGTSADVVVPPNKGSAPPPASGNKGSTPPPPPPPPPPTEEPPPAVKVERIKIAILDFKEPPATAGKGYGSSFANMMTNEMNRGKYFAVVERSMLDKIMAERDLSQTELLEKVEAGATDTKRMLAVKYLLVGNITVEGTAVIVTSRLIDWETGLSPVSANSKRIVGHGASPSFYFDEIARDLRERLEKDYRVNGRNR